MNTQAQVRERVVKLQDVSFPGSIPSPRRVQLDASFLRHASDSVMEALFEVLETGRDGLAQWEEGVTMKLVGRYIDPDNSPGWLEAEARFFRGGKQVASRSLGAVSQPAQLKGQLVQLIRLGQMVE